MWCCPKKGWIAPNLGISMQKLMLYTVVYLLTEHSAWDFMVQFSWSQFIIHRLFKLFTCTAKVIGWLDGLLEPKLETKHDKTQQIWIVFMRVSILNHNQSDMTCWKINFIVPFGKLTVFEVEHNYFNRQINQKNGPSSIQVAMLVYWRALCFQSQRFPSIVDGWLTSRDLPGKRWKLMELDTLW